MMDRIRKITEELMQKIGQREFMPEQLERAERLRREYLSLCDPDCPICHGAGYVQVAFGAVERCPNYPSEKLFHNPRYGLKDCDRALRWGALVET
jgi:hypothetical protein